jgi:hypothetical protein
MITKLTIGVSILLCASLVTAQYNVQPASKMLIRYELAPGLNQLGERLQALDHPINSDDRSIAAIRLCSKNSLPIALATAAADPFVIAGRLQAFGYSPDHILFLRSEDCLSRRTGTSATEVWVIPENARSPNNIDSIPSSQVTVIPLGKQSGRLGMRDYRQALRNLIERLKANPRATGIIIGYVLHKPSPALRRRMSESTRTLERSGLSRDRYLLRLMSWPDEFSEHPPDLEAHYPNVSVIELSKSAN